MSLLLSTCRRMTSNFTPRRLFSIAAKEVSDLPHIPVMVKEVIELLDPQPGQTILDMTFGAGGHSSALLETQPNIKIIALDRDPEAHKYAWQLKSKYGEKVIPLLGKFSDLPSLMKAQGLKFNSIDGILFDLGCSSMQFDEGSRGFAVSKDGPLDMRMDGARDPNGVTAAQVLAHLSELELDKIIRLYGEDKNHSKIASAIVQARYAIQPLQSTSQLCDVVKAACRTEVRRDKLNRKAHIATKVFQAIRIFVNNEINELNHAMILSHKYLKVGGKVVVISFHSLEDRIVKRHFQGIPIDNVTSQIDIKYLCSNQNLNEEVEIFSQKYWQIITKNNKAILPTEEEVLINPRSRSAKIRAAVKLR